MRGKISRGRKTRIELGCSWSAICSSRCCGSSHGFGVAEAIALALDVLPLQCIDHAIEAADFAGRGEPSPEVTDAIDEVPILILAEL
jgi:hypothetical protein